MQLATSDDKYGSVSLYFRTMLLDAKQSLVCRSVGEINKKQMQKKCPYCGKNVIFIHSTKIYGGDHNYGFMKACTDYPVCDSYAGKGASLANKELRELRKTCHALFDMKWRTKQLTRSKCYFWLRRVMNKSHHDAHIAMFRDDECKKLLKLLDPNRDLNGKETKP